MTTSLIIKSIHTNFDELKIFMDEKKHIHALVPFFFLHLSPYDKSNI
jgi:hypothetical protein